MDIDYGLGQTNIDHETGIRYGVIPANEVGQVWYDESKADYGLPTCPQCGNEADSLDTFGDTEFEEYPRYNDYMECDEFFCTECEIVFGSESAYGDEPHGFYVDDELYSAHQHSGDSDIFVTKSPYYTYCGLCSPCAPGAGYLPDTRDKDAGYRAYCFGHDWFEAGRAPYAVYHVSDGSRVYTDRQARVMKAVFARGSVRGE